MTANVKTINGVAIANIKTINGMAIANVKSWNGVDMTSNASIITSVQNVSITIGSGSTSNTATITSVNTSLAAIFFAGFTTTSSANWDEAGTRVELTNATTVTAYRNTGAVGNTCTINATIVEFTSAAIQSIQAGTIAAAATSATATISAVTTANSIVIHLGANGNPGNFNTARYATTLTLTNATTVTSAKSNATGTITTGYMVVEFKAAVLQSIQAVSMTSTGSSTTDTSTITSVNTANTLLIWNGWLSAAAMVDNLYYATLTNGTTITYTRVGTGTTSRTLKYTVLEFASGILNSNQQGSIALSGVSSNTATITSVNTAKALVLWRGFSSDNANTNPSDTLPKIALTNGTTVTATKGANSGTVTTVGYEVPEFI